jgi:hypothetical protein
MVSVTGIIAHACFLTQQYFSSLCVFKLKWEATKEQVESLKLFSMHNQQPKY